MLLNNCHSGRTQPICQLHTAWHPERFFAPGVAGPACRSVGRATVAILCLGAAHNAIAQAKPAAVSSSEARAARALDEAAKSGPVALRGFLYAMPKGTDLHYHLSGGIYAETFLHDAAQDGLCIDTAALAIVKPMAQTAQHSAPAGLRRGPRPRRQRDERPTSLRPAHRFIFHADLRPCLRQVRSRPVL